MAVITGITGTISWTGGNNAQLASTGVEPGTFSINLEGDDHDTTNFSTTGAETHIKGLTSLSGTWEGQLKAPDHGANGLITFSPGTVLNSDFWEMEISRREHRCTAFGASAHAYAPGIWNWGGQFGGFLDDTTAITAVANSSEPATGTFKYQEKGATDNTLSGSIFTYGGEVTATPGELNRYSYSYRGSGDVTHSSPSAGAGILTSGALTGDAANSLVLTASTGRTFTTNAFWTRIYIRCEVGALTVVRVAWRSSDGSLAIA